MKRFLVLMLIALMVSLFSCQTIPEEDLFDGELSDLEIGYIIMVVADVLIIGGTMWAMTTVPDAYPRANPVDPEYEDSYGRN